MSERRAKVGDVVELWTGGETYTVTRRALSGEHDLLVAVHDPGTGGALKQITAAPQAFRVIEPALVAKPDVPTPAFSVGDRVRMKGEATEMVVTGVGPRRIRCEWAKLATYYASLSVAKLERVPDEPAPPA